MSTEDSRSTQAAGQAGLKLAFENWLGSTGYDEDGMFDVDEMEFAFEAGYQEAREAIAAAAPAGTPAREQVIAKLAAAFGPHKAAVSRPADDDHRHPWTEFVPTGRDEQASTLIVFRDDDGQNSMRPLTYGEIADALCGPAAESAAPAPQPEVGDDIAEAEKVISRYREQVSRLTADNERMQDALREALDAEQPQAAPGPDAELAMLRADIADYEALIAKWPKCPSGCNCRIGLPDDADANECGCDGPCNGGDAAPAGTGEGGLPSLVDAWREAARQIEDDTYGEDLYNEGRTCALRECAAQLAAREQPQAAPGPDAAS